MLAEDGTHQPNLVVAQSICEHCCDVTRVTESSVCDYCGHRCRGCASWNEEGTHFERPPCGQGQRCGRRKMVFHGAKTVLDFCSWLFSPQHRNVVAFAHNARSYDSYFLYHYLINNGI